MLHIDIRNSMNLTVTETDEGMDWSKGTNVPNSKYAGKRGPIHAGKRDLFLQREDPLFPQ